LEDMRGMKRWRQMPTESMIFEAYYFNLNQAFASHPFCVSKAFSLPARSPFLKLSRRWSLSKLCLNITSKLSTFLSSFCCIAVFSRCFSLPPLLVQADASPHSLTSSPLLFSLWIVAGGLLVFEPSPARFVCVCFVRRYVSSLCSLRFWYNGIFSNKLPKVSTSLVCLLLTF